MCEVHVKGLSRRAFGLAGVSLLGISALPQVARAAGSAEALALTCIDFRLVDDGIRFLDSLHLTKEYDQVALAGASLAAVSPKFPSSNAAFWDHVDIAKSLHHIKKIVVLDHRDCGAFKVAFGKNFAGEHNAETAQHKTVMAQMKAELAKKHPDLGAEFYLMALGGTAERLI